MPKRRNLRKQGGFSLIELMVGIVIALLAILIIYQVFAVAEGFKRNTTAINDAQQNGLLSSFMLGLQLANAGAGIANGAADLATCADPALANPVADFANSWRPLPLVIIDGGAAAKPDTLLVNYSIASTLVAPAPFQVPAPVSATSFQVQSPGGFHKDDLVIAISKAGACATSKVKTVSLPDGNGIVTLALYAPTTVSMNASALLFNLGPGADAQKIRYDLQNGVLRSTRLIDDQGIALAAPVPNPLASNIVNMKLQYGIDTDGDGLLDTWVSATPPWDPATLLTAPTAAINQIKAVRIGIVVQSEQFDKNYNQDFTWSIFDGAIAGTYPKSIAPPGNWRYRVYESIFPLRNEIWNKQ